MLTSICARIFTGLMIAAALMATTTERAMAIRTDVTPPAVPSIDLVAASDTGSSSTDNITSDNTPTFLTGVSTDTVEVRFFRNGSIQIGSSATPSTSVEYTSYMTLPDGPHTITAVAVDAAGNESAASTGLQITIDTTVVANTPDLLAAFDAGPFDDDNVTNRYSFGSFDFSVAGEEGASVRITESQDGRSRSGVISGGSVVLSLNWNGGTSDVVAEVTDIAGNVATSAPLAVTLENSAPSFTANVIGGSSTTQTTAQVTLSFDVPVFNVDPSDFTITNGATISAVSGSGMSYTLTVTGLTPGSTHQLACDANTDAQSLGGAVLTNGNFCSTTSAFALITVDRTAPSLVSIERFDPDAEQTNADELTWRLTFSEAVTLSSANLSLEGTTATPTAIMCPRGKGDGPGRRMSSYGGGKQLLSKRGESTFCVRASGGDLADLNGTVRLRVSSTVADLAGNTLDNTTPTGVWENYILENIVWTFTDLSLADPAASPTNSDTVVWRIDLSNSPGVSVDASDFTVSGTTADLSLVQQSFHLEVTASGGDLATMNGTIELGVSAGQDMTDVGDRILSNPGFIATQAARLVVVDNIAPTLTSIATDAQSPTAADSLTFTFTFSEPLNPSAANAANFAISGTTATAAVTLVSESVARMVLSGGDLADLNGPVSVSVGASPSIADTAGNLLVQTPPTATNNNTVQVQNDITGPGVTLATPSADPVSRAFPLTVTFTEPVTGFDISDLTLVNAAASGFAGSGASYTATITPAADGAVTVNVAAGTALDAAGNANSAAAPLTVQRDASAPTVLITSTATTVVPGAFPVTVTFNEPVTGFEVSDLVITGAAPSDFAGADASYTLTLTPDGTASITVNIAAGAAVDGAGNASLVAPTFSIAVDDSPPAPVLSAADLTVEGAFPLTVTFGEAVTGFELADLTVTNAAASDLVDGGAGVFTATITPETVGTIQMSLAAGAATDAAGNASTAASLSVEAVSRPIEVSVTVDANTANLADITGTATITNPGSVAIPFRAFSNVPWLTVSPANGIIPSLGDIVLTVEVTEAVNDLEPGDYTGTVTVVREILAGSASVGGSSNANQAQSIIVEIPVSVTLAQRFGTVELIATTPSGPSGEASFTYTSDITALNALTLTTQAGRAQASAGDVLFGTYALSQSLPAGWRVKSLSCAGDLDGGSSFDAGSSSAVIDLDAGESLVCTFENVRDEDAVRIATQRSIRNFMIRRADRLIESAPDLSRRFEERGDTQSGSMGADIDGSGRYQMSLTASLSGMRNAASQTQDAARFANPQRPALDGWDVWLAAEVSGVRDNRALEDAESDFGVAQLGVDYQLAPNLIVGALGQYDWMQDVSGQVFASAGAIAGARVEGEGWMAGPYAIWRIQDSLIFDAMALYGLSDNQVNPLGLYEDDFETDRFMIRTNLTGEFRSGPWRLRPQAGLTHFGETQSAYTDTLGITIPEQTIALGRFRAGPELVWRHNGDQGGWFEVITAMNAVWDYQTADLLSETGQFRGGDGSLRADTRLGLAAMTRWGAMVSLETGYSGLGQGDFEARSLRFEVRLPFGASGRSSGGFAASGAGLFGSDCDSVQAGFEMAALGQSACQEPLQ
jgi:hypothetical protein